MIRIAREIERNRETDRQSGRQKDRQTDRQGQRVKWKDIKNLKKQLKKIKNYELQGDRERQT